MRTDKKESNEVSQTESQPPAGSFRRIVGIVSAWIGLALAVVLLIGYFVYRSTQVEPAAYQQSLERAPTEMAESGDRFESKSFELQNQIHTGGEWQIRLTSDEVNGWLLVDCGEKFPELIPTAVDQPQFSFAENRFELIFRFRRSKLRPLIKMSGDLFVSEEGKLALQIQRVNTGWIPIPIAKFADEVTHQFRQKGFEVTWSELDSNPLALIEIPQDRLKIDQQEIKIASIEILNGEIVIRGNSETKPKQE